MTDKAPHTAFDDRYGVPIQFAESAHEIEISDEPVQRITISNVNSPTIDLLLVPNDSHRLTVAFHGALSNNITPPRFQYFESTRHRKESLLYISDPTISEIPSINLAWYVGTEQHPLREILSEAVQAIAKRLSATEIVLYGHSGGGFAAGAVGHSVPNSISLLLNAQTRIQHYESWAVEAFRTSAFPSTHSIDDLFQEYGTRIDLTHLYATPRAEDHRILAYQTRGDTLHWEKHWLPLAKSLGGEGTGLTTSGDCFREATWGKTHAGPGSVSPFIDEAYEFLADTEAYARTATVSIAKLFPHIGGRHTTGIQPSSGIPEFAQQRRWNRSRLMPLPFTPLDQLTETWECDASFDNEPKPYWYLGLLDHHFGHFVTETMSRVWWHLDNNQNNTRRAVLVPLSGRQQGDLSVTAPTLTQWQTEFLTYFNIQDPLILDHPTIFEDLLIPEQGAILFSDIHTKSFTSALATHARNNLTPGSDKRIFLRRPPASSPTGVAAEDTIAEFFSQNGYRCVSPESLSIQEQLSLMYGAEHVISTEGSALHLLNMLGEASKATVVSMQRLSDWSSSAFQKTLRPYVAELTNIPPLLRFDTGTDSRTQLLLTNIDALLEQAHRYDGQIRVNEFDFKAYYRQAVAEIGLTSGQTGTFIRQM